MLKRILSITAISLIASAPSLVHAGVSTTLAIDTTQSTVDIGEEVTFNVSLACAWANVHDNGSGTIQFFIDSDTDTNIGDPIYVPDISLTSYQYSDSITYTFTSAGTYVVDAKIEGTLNCNIPTVNSGEPITITVKAAAATTTTQQSTDSTIAETGSTSGTKVAFAALLLASGAFLVVRRRHA